MKLTIMIATPDESCYPCEFVSRDEVVFEPGPVSELVAVNLISNVESNNVVSSVTVSDAAPILLVSKPDGSSRL